MLRYHPLLFLFALSLIGFSFAQSGGATISFSGSCPIGTVINQSSHVINFSLNNTGNAEATNLGISPSLPGVRVINDVVEVQAFGVVNKTFQFELANITDLPGKYVGAFNLNYVQSGSTFFDVFPCVYYVDGTAIPNIVIQNVNITKTGVYSGTAKVEVLNFGYNSINLTVSEYSPENFNVTPENVSLELPPKSTKVATFNIKALESPALTNGSFQMIFYASYINGGLHYSTSPYDAVFSVVQQSNVFKQSIVFYTFVFLIILIAALVLMSIFINRHKKKSNKK